MKICSVIAEYNPLHNGHISQLNFIREKIKPDYLIVVMSGSFTQRGETAIIDKYQRARHAVLAGADAVIELPTVFATANAEYFAKGAIKLINSLPGEKVVCFGSELGDIDKLKGVANALLNENDDFKRIVKLELEKGNSYLKAITLALETTTDGNYGDILSSPNNVLGIEYLKAIIKNGYDIEAVTIKREGASYNDKLAFEKIPSASSVRNAIELNKKRKIKKGVPSYVYNSLPKTLINVNKQIIYSLLSTDKSEIAKTLDCGEGLENAIKAAAKGGLSVDEILSALVSKRYTTARIKRIMTATLLKINGDFIKEAEKSSLYLKILAINAKKQDLLGVLSNSSYPLITRKSDALNLTSTALQVFEKDEFALELYSSENSEKLNPYQTLFI